LLTESEAAVPPLTCHVNVEELPVVIVLGEATKLNVSGTVTVTVAVAVPPGPDAVMVKTVVEFTGITADPEVLKLPPLSPCCTEGVIVTDVAFVVAHAIVVV
jgi:hypothetical protein